MSRRLLRHPPAFWSTLKTIKLLKSYNLTGERFETMNDAMLRLKKISFRTEVWAAIPIQIFLFCLDAGYLVTLFAAVKMCAAGSLSVQGLFSFAFIGYFLFETVKSLGPQLVELRYVSHILKAHRRSIRIGGTALQRAEATA